MNRTPAAKNAIDTAWLIGEALYAQLVAGRPGTAREISQRVLPLFYSHSVQWYPIGR